MPRTAPLLIGLIAVANEEIVRRLSRRRVCGSCSLTQSVSVDADVQLDPCPYCGGNLVRRRDDDPETVNRRLSTYAAFAQPVIEYYRSRPSFASIDGLRDPDVVTAALCRHIDASSERK
jgi:adenylate kinase